MACDPSTMPQDAGCFGCIPPEYHAAVQSYLLAKIRGGSMDAAEIVREAACMSCIPPAALPSVRSYLLCQLANTGGGGGGVIPSPPECDSDAMAFLTAANITDEFKRGAICVLVRDLKAYPAVGTKYWDRDYIIYPFVSNSADSNAQRAASHAVNLKTPGTYNLAYGAGLITHSDTGMLGSGAANAYARTGYVPRTSLPAWNINDCRVFSFTHATDATVNNRIYGCTSDGAVNRLQSLYNGVTVGSQQDEQNTAIQGPLSANASLAQTSGVATRQLGINGEAFSASLYTQTNSPRCELFLLAVNNNVVAPAINPTNFSKFEIDGFALGNGVFSQAEATEYYTIWAQFQSTMGRL